MDKIKKWELVDKIEKGEPVIVEVDFAKIARCGMDIYKLFNKHQLNVTEMVLLMKILQQFVETQVSVDLPWKL